jgi:hypothetical protein
VRAGIKAARGDVLGARLKLALRRIADDGDSCSTEGRPLRRTDSVKAWTSEDRRCFACCVGAILELGPEAADDLEALPPSFFMSWLAMAEYSAALEERFGVRLRQLDAPPIERLWIAAIQSAVDGEDGHAVVAKGRTIVYDPVANSIGRAGEALPARFGQRLVAGFELVEA